MIDTSEISKGKYIDSHSLLKVNFSAVKISIQNIFSIK